jgi:Domain of unknown function (DUF4190)/Protein of unknown function (DUF2510)
MAEGVQTPAGWYTDPANPSTQRYWDGLAWAAPGAVPPPPPTVYVVQKQSTNGLAIASMVLGILWLYWIGSVLALIFGYIAKRQIATSQGREGGRGMAIAGIVLGWIGVGTAILVFTLVVVVSTSGSHGASTTFGRCAATKDAALAASAVFYADHSAFPTRFTDPNIGGTPCIRPRRRDCDRSYGDRRRLDTHDERRW